MSRVVKFRGKALMSIEELNAMHFQHDNGWFIGNLIVNNGKPYIVGDIADESEEYIAHEWWIRVDPKTVGQFTGLLDKNGKEIYEGDVVTGFRQGNWHGGIDKVKGVVKYREQIVGYTIDSSGSKALYNGGKLHDVDELEDIGNIYEHPHLLEVPE